MLPAQTTQTAQTRATSQAATAVRIKLATLLVIPQIPVTLLTAAILQTKAVTNPLTAVILQTAVNDFVNL